MTKLLIILAAPLFLRSATASPLYAALDLSSIAPAGVTKLNALAINNAGQVLVEGNCGGTSCAYVYNSVGGTWTQIGPAGTTVYAINNLGQVVGDNSSGAFIDSGGTLTYYATGASTAGFGINDSGTVVGVSNNDPMEYSGGVITNLAPLVEPGYESQPLYTGVAYNIDNAGDIVGNNSPYPGQQVAYLYASGTLTTFGQSGNCIGYPSPISNGGQVAVGLNTGAGGCNSYIYSGGVLTNLGLLADNAGGGPYQHTSVPYGINDSGQVVGADISEAANYVAYLYLGGQLYDLNTLDGTGVPELATAWGINNNGWIVADEAEGNGAFLLTPVNTTPEPGSSMLVLLGVAILTAGTITRRSRGRKQTNSRNCADSRRT